MYGHYREAKFSQIKLHWTWVWFQVLIFLSFDLELERNLKKKINFVVDKIGEIINYEYIILLEEDHYLSPDALVVADNEIIPAVNNCERNGLNYTV